MTEQINKHQKLIYYWALKVLHNHDDAMEASQDVYIKLMSFDEEKKSSTAWLRKITVNHCIDVIRKNKAERNKIAEGYKDRTESKFEADTSNSRMNDQNVKIVQAISELSEMQQIVILAKIFDKDTFSSISIKLNISESAAKTHYFRGIKKLHSILKPINE